MKYYLIYFSLFLSSLITHCHADHEPTVLVTLPPYQELVERIAEQTVRVEVLVPPGASTHTYSPSPSQVIKMGKANLWFRIGEIAEEATARAILSHNPQMQLVDLRQGLNLIGGEGHSHCCGNHHDPHIWLSPKMLKQQVETLADNLIRLRPDQEELYLKNTQSLLREIGELDQEIAHLLRKSKGETILVAHPAFGYLCRDYGLIQMAIEHEGKDPHPRRLTEIIQEARRLKINRIYAQPQHSPKGAEQIGKAIGAKVIVLDPNKKEVLQNLKGIARAFTQ